MDEVASDRIFDLSDQRMFIWSSAWAGKEGHLTILAPLDRSDACGLRALDRGGDHTRSTRIMNEAEIFQPYQVRRRENDSVWELGRGSMGATYKASDTDLHCEVALKVILPQILHNEDSKGCFLREARLAARLRHPNIAAIFHLGRTADESF